VFHPIFSAELLDSAQMLGLGLTLQNPLRARVLVKTRTAELATQLARQIHDEPQRWLRLQGSDQLLYTQSPEISRQDNNLEIRFNVPETSIRLLLQRIARTDAPAAGMVQPSPTP
jgi:plasmid maintenance system antidote protein VapI